jgi:hypothetical protein
LFKKKKLNLKHTQIHHAIVAVTPFFTSEHWYSWVQLHLAINCIYTHYAANDTAKKKPPIQQQLHLSFYLVVQSAIFKKNW